MEYILETERLKMRKITLDDFNGIYNLLSDIEIMYAWEHSFSEKETRNWIMENIRRYIQDGFSYYIVLRKEDNQIIGLAGIILEEVETDKYVGLGYIFDKKHWNKGYAFESVEGLVKYAFEELTLNEITAQIRPNNLTSIKLAEKLGMKPIKEFNKLYKGKQMKHILYIYKNIIE